MESPVRIELTMSVLQTDPLPLGYGDGDVYVSDILFKLSVCDFIQQSHMKLREIKQESQGQKKKGSVFASFAPPSGFEPEIP
jgi:hypothetical protein